MLEMKTQTDPTEISVAAKERLAKLLATENITVEHRNVPTAMFDIKGRVLILPNWKDITKDIYDLLVLHEVGHALHTPLEGWHGAVSEKGPNYKGFLNVTEDARIEKKQKRKFPGGRRSFINGYKELLARDFFGIKDRDIGSFGLIDRLNIHFKVGQAAHVPFSFDEGVWVERMAALETFEEAKLLADDLFDLMAADQAPETDTGRGGCEGEGEPEEGEEGEEGQGVGDSDEDEDDSDSEEGGSFTSDGDEADTDGDSESGSGEGDSSKGDENSSDGEGDSSSDDDADGDGESESGADDAADDSDGDDDSSNDDDSPSGDLGARGGKTKMGGDPISETDKAFREKEESLVDASENAAPTYVQVPKDSAFNLDSIIIPNKEVTRALKEAASLYKESALETAAREVKAYRNANAKVVNYLAKEFEMRKAADASKRTTVSKTGILDTNTLHSYKWNDDIFKKVASVADGKSHGLQLFVDWSGSMHYNMFGTLDQVLNLVLFCKKVGIPFDVYAFTDGYDRAYYNSETDEREKILPNRMHKDKLERGDLEFRKTKFNLLQIATSQGNRAAFNDMLMGLIMLRGHFGPNGRYATSDHSKDAISYYNIPNKYGLCGTPLNEAILSSIPIINRFREANDLQIVNSVFLTDGEGCDVSRAHGVEGMGRYGGKVIIRDRKSRKEFLQKEYYGEAGDSQMSILLEMVRIRTGAKVVNFYVTASSPSGFKNEWMGSVPRLEDEFGNMRPDEDGAKAAFKVAKAEGGVVLEDSIHGWDHHYLILGGSALGVHADEGLDDSLVGAKKGKLKAAFGKAASGKLKNRVVLRKFTELIAA
jgi:hypothetical protein